MLSVMVKWLYLSSYLRKALREDVCACKFHMIFHATEGKVSAFVLKQICPEAVLLLGYPGQGKSCGKMDTGRGQPADIQLSGNGGKGENIIIAVGHLVGDKFLVFLSDQIIPALIDQQIAFECGFFVIDSNAGFEATVGGLDIAVAVVDADDDGVIVHKIHIGSFLPHSGGTTESDLT